MPANSKPKLVKVRTLVAVSGTEFSLAAGDIWELSEANAKLRIKLGLAEAVEPDEPVELDAEPVEPDEPDEPPAERMTVSRGGKQVKTASVKPDEERGEINA